MTVRRLWWRKESCSVSGQFIAESTAGGYTTQKDLTGTIVVFGGSEGSANHLLSRELQSEGFDVISAYYFGQPGQQEQLVEVPLEIFDEILARVDEGPITVIGTSKGAELTANLAARYDEIDHIVLFAPAEYTYAGLSFGGPDQFSSFTYGGEPVEFAPFPTQYDGAFTMLSRTFLGLPVSYRASYEAAAASAPKGAKIDLSKFTGTGLAFAGDADPMWQSEVAARDLSAAVPGIEVVVYSGAGHLFAEDITKVYPGWETMLGGTVEANRNAKHDSDAKLLTALLTWHH
ncbi:alpha/beta hydrolase [Corynebacterium lubricantis]|uniref:alpha/beta hydrolase n=1 Tax=Corynebacterium lubricantis TaxID=541095 RepID=UPI0003A2C288|nr:alpha/beta hydrolase [Corynebacterium lubricantis]